MEEALYEEYIGHYEAGGRRGSVGLFRGANRGGARAPGPLYRRLITDKFVQEKPEGRAGGMAQLLKGLAILELVCVNLFLYPWRKEIRTLKKFTGNFVYFVEPVIPEKMLTYILQRVGYSIVRETEFVIGGTINIEEAKRTAFELYLARLYCEDLLGAIRENKGQRVKIGEPQLDIRGEKGNKEQSDHHGADTGRVVYDSNEVRECRGADMELEQGMDDSKQFRELQGADTEKVRGVYDSTEPCDHQGANTERGEGLYELSHHQGAKTERGEGLYELSHHQGAKTERGEGLYELSHHQGSHTEHDSNVDGRKVRTSKAAVGFGLPEDTDQMKDDSSLDSHYSFCRPLDSEEFLNKYSDLNLAQQPILPLQSRKTASKPQEMREERLYRVLEESTFHKPYNPESFKREPGQNMKVKSETGPNSQRQPERLVIKLKMGTMADEALTYPIEETVPPESGLSHPSWTLPKNRVATEEESSLPKLSSSFSTLNVTPSQVTERGEENHLQKVREPPSSMYIPPGGGNRQCLKITDLPAEENHYQAPSPPGDMVVVSETVFKVNEDVKEGFVVITRKDNLKN